MTATTTGGAVYRALMGGYETLREEPVAADSRLPFICFTDDPELTSETWEIVRVPPRISGDAIRSARFLKLRGHERLAGFDRTLWVDNTVELLVPPEEFLDDWLADADVAAPLHSTRESVLGEAEAVLDIGKDDPSRVYEQVAVYARTAPDALRLNPHWTGMLARRRTPQVDAAMQVWWEHVLRYSRRDQLSFTVAMAGSGLRLGSVPLPNQESGLHRWPRADHRRTDRPEDSLRTALRPPVAELGVLELERERLSNALTGAAHERDLLTGERDKLALVAREAEGRLLELEAEVAVLRDHVKVLEAADQEKTEHLGVLQEQTSQLRIRVRRQRARRIALESVLAQLGERPRSRLLERRRGWAAEAGPLRLGR